MEEIKILIADSSLQFRSDLSRTLQDSFLVRTAGNGEETLQALRDFLPDILVLDLMLSGTDGLTLAQDAARLGIHPAILATTPFLSNYILETADRMEIGYLMLKPCDIDATAARLRDMSLRLTHHLSGARATISNTLLRLGFRSSLRGFSYLLEAAVLMADSPAQSITRELYPAVASRCGATVTQVERSIRNAVFTAWDQGDPKIWRRYFPNGKTATLPCPTNATLISRLADLALLNEPCRE